MKCTLNFFLPVQGISMNLKKMEQFQVLWH